MKETGCFNNDFNTSTCISPFVLVVERLLIEADYFMGHFKNITHWTFLCAMLFLIPIWWSKPDLYEYDSILFFRLISHYSLRWHAVGLAAVSNWAQSRPRRSRSPSWIVALCAPLRTSHGTHVSVGWSAFVRSPFSACSVRPSSFFAQLEIWSAKHSKSGVWWIVL